VRTFGAEGLRELQAQADALSEVSAPRHAVNLGFRAHIVRPAVPEVGHSQQQRAVIHLERLEARTPARIHLGVRERERERIEREKERAREGGGEEKGRERVGGRGGRERDEE